MTYGAKLLRSGSSLRVRDDKGARFVLDPPYRKQAAEFHVAMERIWDQGGWTLYVDELFYIDHLLGLGDDVTRLLTQGRSKGISVVCGMQRPVAVTRFALGEATHVVSFGLEGRDVKTLAETTSQDMGRVVSTLRRHEFAWFNRHEPRAIWRGRAQDLYTEAA